MKKNLQQNENKSRLGLLCELGFQTGIRRQTVIIHAVFTNLISVAQLAMTRFHWNMLSNAVIRFTAENVLTWFLLCFCFQLSERKSVNVL